MVDYVQENNIATLWVNNPPVNSLSSNVRQGIYDGIARANDDPTVKAIVIAGRNRTFIAGADIKEFSNSDGNISVSLVEVTDQLENSSKPVIAAIENFCMGGGLEVAISCHYRIAHHKTRFAFPEVNLGILPGATGTQRFPRLTSLRFALDIIPSGRVFSAEEAFDNSAVDKIVDDKVYEAALNFASTVIDKDFNSRRTSKRSPPDTDLLGDLVSKAYVTNSKRFKELAPKYCIKAVAAAAKPYDQGLLIERDLAFQLFTSGQANALQYAFFAERSTSKWELPGGFNWKNTNGRPINSVAIVGSGKMTAGIVTCFLRAKIRTFVFNTTEMANRQVFINSMNILANDRKKRRITAEEYYIYLSYFTYAKSPKIIAKVDAVIDDLPQDVNIKRDIFQKLDRICKPSTIFCTMEIEKIASATKRPKMVIGTHFFAPANVMRLLEVEYGPETAPRTVAAIMNMGKKIRKVSVLVSNRTGVVANRLMGVGTDQAVFMLEDGINDQRLIDNCMEDFGMAMGKFKTIDIIGMDANVDVLRKTLNEQGYDLDENRNMVRKSLNNFLHSYTYYAFFKYGSRRYPLFTYELSVLGKKGERNGYGYYRYTTENRQPIYDEEIVEILKNYRKRMGIQTRTFTYQEIFERCLYSSVNEGFKILEEKIAHKPQDIDVMSLMGYGFPRQVGGIMKFAETTGTERIYEAVCRYNKLYPDQPCWRPSKLLERVAKENIPMKYWGQIANSMSKL
ncbi:DgyrCDS8380 [Dimorphilus gyrociliatus]|uniref:Peroxisomal bifunctional enzyme n=1 Tax=Dimorphilus gyrociliatus TaxID=2664684 RepID=A0A7I8VWB5_9ANNE|nr:DgyrCDS8380 [Dimorphilus gyrociliatus]